MSIAYTYIVCMNECKSTDDACTAGVITTYSLDLFRALISSRGDFNSLNIP